jgi:hypothetical protein
MHILLAVTLALAAPVPTEDAGVARAKAIAPLLDGQAYAVLRADFTKTDAEALLTMLADLGLIEPAEAKALKNDAGKWVGAFTKAGGKELYFVLSATPGPAAYFAAVPLGDGADATALTQLLGDTLAPPGPREKVGNLLVAGDKATLEQVSKLKPSENAELAKAFVTTGDGAVQIILLSPARLALAIAKIDKEMAPMARSIARVISKNLNKGITWTAIGVDLAPKRAVRLTVQTADAEAARTLVPDLAEVVRLLGDKQDGLDALSEFDKIAGRLAPTVSVDRLVLTLDDKDTVTALQPVLRRGIELAALTRSSSNLKRITIGAHQHHDALGTLPAVANFDKAGKPLLSWRVHLLPYIGEGPLYKEFHLDEPWDSQHNKKLIARMPAVYAVLNPVINAAGKTVLLAPTGKNTCWQGGKRGLQLTQIPDGTSNTIFLVLADNAHAVEWTKPDDLKIDPAKPHDGLGRQSGRFVVVTADGALHLLKTTISKETLKNAFDPADGNVLGNDW